MGDGPADPARRAAYKRVLLKLSGEALMGPEGYGISPAVLAQIAGEIKETVQATDIELALDQGEIETDKEAADNWLAQPGFVADHLVYYGRKDNFWEMADTGPCGPNSEIYYDFGPEFGELKKNAEGQLALDGPQYSTLGSSAPKRSPISSVSSEAGCSEPRIASS